MCFRIEMTVPGLLYAAVVVALVSRGTCSGDRRPHFLVQPPSRLPWPTTRGATAVCRAAGHPTPELHWLTAEGQLLTTIPGLRHVESDGRLVLGARRSLLDAGGAVLRCRASNRAGVVLSRPVLLQPVEDSVLSHTVRQLTPAKTGHTLLLKCEVSPQLGLVEVRWLQNRLPLPVDFSAVDSRWTSGAGGLLLGSDVTNSDVQAEYTCVVSDVPSSPLKLTTDDTSWLDNTELSSLEAREGDTVVLPCIQRYSSAHAVSWQRQHASGEWGALSGTDVLVRGGALVLASARPDHTGRYACAAGTQNTPRILIRLVVFEPLTVTVSPNPMLIGTGGSAFFNCTVNGGRGSGVSVGWQHEGRSLHAPHTRLAVGPVRSHHAGLYQCTVHDHVDTGVAEAELLIADRPPRLVTTFTEAISRPGQSIALRCVATGLPPPRILWTLDDRPLPAAPEKYSVTTRAETSPGDEDSSIVSTLSVTIRTADEGGRYGCNATNSRGSHSHHARLNVFGPPNIRYLPAIHVKAESDVTLYCPYSGYPIKEVIWKKEDGSSLDSSIESSNEGVLRLTAVRSSSAGGYTCEVRAESGELARRTVKIDVHKPPKIAPFHFPEEVEVGGSTQATCSLISGDKPIQFTWLKDNLPIPPILKVEQKNMDFFTILIIQELSSSHSGEYTCKASNDFGTVTHSASLIVKEPPTWVWRAQNTSLSAGSALLLPCSAKGQPAPRVSWEYSSDGENWRHILWGQTEPTDANSGSILADGTIWLRSANAQHEGWYKCAARAQHAVLHHSFYLDVREPPRLTRSGDGGETRWVVRGATARLACIVRGEPEIHLHWTHDSRPLALHGAGGVETREAGSGSLLSEITITHSGPEHAGEYKCHARNLYGNDELLFKLFVKERPNIPDEVRISEVWSRRARISWRMSRGAMVTHYTIQYRELTREHNVPLDSPLPNIADDWNTPDVFNMSLANSELLNIPSEGSGRAGASVPGLSPDTRYALRIAAFNDVGASMYTTPVHFTTREEAPGGPPRDITVRALRHRELHVSWLAPPRETWHGTILGYTVRWWEMSEDTDSGVKEHPGTESGAGADATSATIRGLKSATRYAVTIRAYNAAGTGPASQPHYRHTLESPPTGGPESLSCLASGSTSLRVSWRMPAADSRGGHITHYTLQYTRRDSDPLSPPQDAYLRVQGEEATISRLSPYAEYEIRVRAHNAAGDGPLSASQVCRTDEDLPSAPGGMKLIALSERSLRASWLPPSEPNGKITYYTLYIKDLSGSQEPNTTRINSCAEGDNGSMECMKSLRGLRGGRTYEAWVKAATSAGDGPPSVSVACQTSSLAPARISSFGGVTVASAGSTITLRCVVGGAPPPAKRWLRGGVPLHPRPPFHLDGDALIIRNVELSHADNYTCVAENPHGSDSATWKLVVLRPPPPPTLALLEARARELELELRPAPRTLGHALPRSYTLHWRLSAPEGEWRIQQASPGPVSLSGLRCGSAYKAYASAGGAPGSELAVRTSGGPPSAPADARWIRMNGTHARFDTSLWMDGGCGPVALRLEWAGAGVVGARDVPVGGEVILGGLTPGSRYRVAARASNEAGWTREVYEFSTTQSEGGLAAEVDAPFPATAGELALLLALCAALSLAALTILAILLRRKRNVAGPALGSLPPEKPGCGTYRPPPHQTPKLPPDPPEVYEISPYATFAGPPGVGAVSRAYTLQLRALARHDDEAAPPPTLPCCDEETCVDACEGQRRRRRRRHYCPDHGCSQDSGS